MTRPPPGLLARGADDALARAVLADWYEGHGQERWAAWVREGRGWREVDRALRPAGGRLRQLDLGFLHVPEGPPRPGQGSLAWQVRRPAALDALLDTPVWFAADAFHLAGWRARTAVASVLGRLAHRPVRTVETTGVALDPTVLERFPELEHATLRLPREPREAELPVRELCVRTRDPEDLASLAAVRTPNLRVLTLVTAPGVRWRPDAAALARLERVLERPLQTVWLDWVLRTSLAPLLARRAPPAVRTRDRPERPPDPTRWTVDW